MTLAIVLSFCLQLNIESKPVVSTLDFKNSEDVISKLDVLLKHRKYDSVLLVGGKARHGKWKESDRMKLFYILGEGYRKTLTFDSAEFFYKASIQLASEVQNTEYYIKALDKLGSNYRQSGKNYLALETYLKNLKLKNSYLDDSKESSYSLGLANEYLGITYYVLGKDSLAIPHYSEAVKKYQEAEKSRRELACINNLGLSYLHWAQEIRRQPYLFDSEEKERRQELLRLALKQFEIVRSDTNYTRRALLYQNLSATYSDLEILDSAYYYISQCKILREKDDSDMLAYTYNNLGLIHHQKGNYDSAKFYYTKSFQEGKALLKKGYKDIDDLMLPLYTNYSDYFLDKAVYDSAYHYLLQFLELKRKNLNKESNEQIQQLFVMNETEKKEKEILSQQAEIEQTKLERNNLLYGSFAIITFAFLAISFYYQRNRRIRLVSQRNSEVHKNEITRLLATQESRTFDALIEGQEKERSRVAEELHDRLGSTLSAAKMHLESIDSEDNAQHQLIGKLIDKAVEDTRQISHNMLSGVLTKFGLVAALNDLKETVNASNKLKVELKTIQFDERLEMEKELNIYRITQELLSNTLKHADARNFSVLLKKEEKSILLTISDDGTGIAENSNGIGLINVNSRVTKMKGTWEILFEEGKGARATFVIPIV